MAHSPQTAGYASNESVRQYDLRRTPCNHLIFNDNAIHDGLVQGFLISSDCHISRLACRNFKWREVVFENTFFVGRLFSSYQWGFDIDSDIPPRIASVGACGASGGARLLCS
jgi:hypothetical protein